MLIVPDEYQEFVLKWLQDYGDHIEGELEKVTTDELMLNLQATQERLEMFIASTEDGDFTWNFTPVQMQFWGTLIVYIGKYLAYLIALKANRSERKDVEVVLASLRNIYKHGFTSAAVAGVLEQKVEDVPNDEGV